MDNIKEFVERYTTFDEKIPYKRLEINSIKVKDWFKFMSAYDILNIDKTGTNDVNIIQMSYLDFISNLVFNESIWRDKFLIILELCLGIKYNEEYIDNSFEPKEILCKPINDDLVEIFINGYNIKFYRYSNKIDIKINDIEINSTQFDEVVRLIKYQNFIDYNDDYINPDVKQAIEDFWRIKNKNVAMPSLEQKIAVVSSMIGLLKKDIKNMSYREFDNIFTFCQNRIDYQVNKTAELSGNVQFKKPIEHWIYHKPFNPFEEAFTSYDSFKNKITSV